MEHKRNGIFIESAGKLARKIAEFNNRYDNDYVTLYQEFRIPKRTGGYRIPTHPYEPLKKFTKRSVKFS